MKHFPFPVLIAFSLFTAKAQTIPQPLQVVRVYNVTSASQVFDNRSTAAMGCNYFSYYVNSNVGAYTIQLEYSDVSRTGPWTPFPTSQITNTSFVPIGVGNGYHNWVRLNTLSGSTSSTLSCSKDYFITSSASSISAIADPGLNCIPYRSGAGEARCVVVSDIANLFGSLAEHYVYAAPENANGLPSFRQMYADDISFTQTGAGAVASTVDAKLRETISVKDFGAKGDGVTDDTAAIQAALTAAGTSCGLVYFPHGTYMMSVTAGSLTGTVIPSCVEMAGESNTGAVIKLKSAAFNGEWFSSNGTHNITIRDLTFDGANAPINSGYGTVTTNGTAVTLVTGTPFYTDGTWAGLPFVINYVYYTIASVTDSSHLVLTATAGVQSSAVTYFSVGLMYQVIGMVNASYVTIRDCRFVNVFPTLVVAFYGGAGFITLDHNYIETTAASGNQNEGFNISTGGPYAMNGVRVTNNTLVHTGMDINTYGAHVEGNDISGWGYGAGITTEVSALCGYNLISRNMLVSSTGIDTNATRPNAIEDWASYDRITENFVSGMSGDGIDAGGPNTLIANNITIDNGSSAPGAGCGISARYGNDTYQCSYCTFTGNVSLDTNSNLALGTQGYGFCIQASPSGTLPTHVFVTPDNNFNHNMENPTNTVLAQGTVTTNHNIITWASGSPFVTSGPWFNGMTIVINNVAYSIGNVGSATALAVNEDSGVQATAVPYYVPAFDQTKAVWALSQGVPPSFPYCVAWTPGTIAAGATASVQETVPGAQMGSTIAPPSFSLNAGGVLFYGYVYTPNAITFVAYNLSGASQTLATGQICTTVTMPLGYSNY